MILKIKNTYNKDELFDFCRYILNIFVHFLEGINISIISYEVEKEKFTNIINFILSNIDESLIEIFFEKLVKIAYLNIKFTKNIDSQILHLMERALLRIENEKTINKISYNLIYTFILNVSKSKIPIEKINEILTYIINIIIKSYSFTSDNSFNLTLLLTFLIINGFKTYNLNNTQLKLLLNNAYECYYIEIEDYSYQQIKLINNLIIISIISLSFIFYPDNTYNILNNFDEIKENKLEQYLLLIKLNNENNNIDNKNFYNIKFLLRKINILGLYSIIKNIIFKNNIKNNTNKINILESFILLISNKEENIYNSFLSNMEQKNVFKITKNDVNENEYINEINIEIKNILDKNCVFNNIDENFLFNEIINYIQINHNELFYKLKSNINII